MALLAACSNMQAPVQPQGPAAARIAQFWWVLLTVATIVFVIVMALLIYALFRYRRDSDSGGIGEGNNFIIIGGALIPALVLVGVMFYTVDVQNFLSKVRPPALTIEVTGHQWWWEINYPDQGFITANEIHIPVGKPVALKLTSADVIHSFWAPELQAKMDLCRGKPTRHGFKPTRRASIAPSAPNSADCNTPT